MLDPIKEISEGSVDPSELNNDELWERLVDTDPNFSKSTIDRGPTLKQAFILTASQRFEIIKASIVPSLDEALITSGTDNAVQAGAYRVIVTKTNAALSTLVAGQTLKSIDQSIEIPAPPGKCLPEIPITPTITIETVADVAGSLDAKGFYLYDEDGSVAIWIDVDDSGTAIPAWAEAADRAIEETGIVTGDTDAAVAAALAATINADAKFSATAVGNLITVNQHGEDEDTGFTFVVSEHVWTRIA